MENNLDQISEIVPINKIQGEDTKDAQLLNKMYFDAKKYIQSFRWCEKVITAYFGFGVGGIVAVFLFEIENKQSEIDKYLWVVVGDIPSAYIVTDCAKNPYSALGVYIGLMQDWVNAVVSNKSVSDCYPINTAANLENAKSLQRRIDFLKQEFMSA